MAVVFGAGGDAVRLIYYENQLKNEFFIDNDPEKTGGQFYGFDVVKPEAIVGMELDAVLLSSRRYASEMKEQLIRLGIDESRIVSAWELELFGEEADVTEPDSACFLASQIRTKEEYDQFRGNSAWSQIETVLEEMVLQSPRKRISYPGRCQVCRKRVNLLIDNQYSESPRKVNFRERMVCPFCGLNNRQREIARLVTDRVPGDARVYITEQVTPMYQYLSRQFVHLTGSEYMGPDIPGGKICEGGVIHEDLTALSFADETIDCVISNDVFEHVSDIDRALEEIYRVLKAGGMLYATFPMNFHQEQTVKRAEMVDGTILHRQEPAYHGNPVSEEGSLVFYDYGMDFFSRIRKAGFSDGYFVPFYSIPYGNIGNRSLFIFIATK